MQIGGDFMCDDMLINQFDNIDDFLDYLDIVIKKNNSNADDGESKAHDCNGRNNHNFYDLDI